MVVDEADVLDAVRDFLEHSGHVECMRVLEKSAGICPPDVSEEMRFLRELTLDGRWKEVRDFVEVLADTEHKYAYNECRYEVIEQQYLEAIQGAPWDKTLLEQALQHLEELRLTKPRDEVYSKLEQLLPVTSVDKNYTECEKYRSRLRCFHRLLSSLRTVLYPGPAKAAPNPFPAPLSHDRLCLLLLKGRLYEECENTCRERCGRGLPAGALHLGSWIGRLPDTAFNHELFTTMSMAVNPYTPAPEPGGRAGTPTTDMLQAMGPSDPLKEDGPPSPHAHCPGEDVVGPNTLKTTSPPVHSSVLRFENDFVQGVVITPINAPLGKHTSSTPKHLIPSAPPLNSSPVPYVPGTHWLHDTPHLSRHMTTTSKDAPREWPSLALRGTVTDTQVR